MKKLTILIILVCIIQTTVNSQSCLPEGIRFETQAHIDSFQINYPNCTEIEGDVIIGGWEPTEITNLTGLSVLTSIHGNLYIARNQSLTTLTGLDNLTSVDGSVNIGTYTVDALFGGIGCMGNPSLSSLTGLDNLTYIGGDLNIFCNEKLTNLTGLGNLTTIEGDLNIGHAHTLWIIGGVVSAGNQLITTLSGMENMSFIGGNLKIAGNEALTTLSGLNIETYIGGSLSIKYNDTLSLCEAQSICDYLGNPNGTVEIHSNSPRCNNLVEVANNCGITLSCLPFGNYYFLNQGDVDEFQVNFPLCNEIKGDVIIYGSDIMNLNGLSSINSIEGDLRIGKQDASCKTVLTSLSGLEGLTSLRGSLKITFNDLLANLEGLENIDAATLTEVRISYNDTLAHCEVKSICEYLAAPAGEIYIRGNSLGCNSPEEVQDSCWVSIYEYGVILGLKIHPNPFGQTTTVEYELRQASTVQFTIYNQLGKQVESLKKNQSSGKQQFVWNAEGLPCGVYFCVLKTESGIQSIKMIKIK